MWQALKEEGGIWARESVRARVVSRPNSLPLPFRTPATQANTEVAIESVPINGGPFKAG